MVGWQTGLIESGIHNAQIAILSEVIAIDPTIQTDVRIKTLSLGEWEA